MYITQNQGIPLYIDYNIGLSVHMDLVAIHAKMQNESMVQSVDYTCKVCTYSGTLYSGHPGNDDTLIHKTHVTLSNTVCAYTTDLLISGDLTTQDTFFCPKGVHITLYTNMCVISRPTLMCRWAVCGEESIASVSPVNSTNKLGRIWGLPCFSHSTAGL